MDEIKKRLKEHYLKVKREHGWSEDEMVLNMKSRAETSRKEAKKSSLKEGVLIVESIATRRLIVGT